MKSAATFPPGKNAEKKLRVWKSQQKSTKIEEIDIRLNELAEWGPGWRFLRSLSVILELGLRKAEGSSANPFFYTK